MKKIIIRLVVLMLVFIFVPFQNSFSQTFFTRIEVEEEVWLGNFDDQMGSRISFIETETSSWKEGDSIFLNLPLGITWNENTEINGRRINSDFVGQREIEVEVNPTQSLDRINLTPVFNVDRNVPKGVFEITVEGQNIKDEEKILIGEIKDFGVEMSVSRENKFHYLNPKPFEIKIQLEENLEESLLASQKYDLIVKNATIDQEKPVDIRTLNSDKTLNANIENDSIIEIQPNKDEGRGKWEIIFTIIPSKEFEGDIILEFLGRSISNEVILGSVSNNIEIISGTPINVGLGVQSQGINPIIIKEKESGSLLKGRYLLEIDPNHRGVNFSEADIEVSSGNVEIGNFSYNDGIIEFEVQSQSINPSTIEIKNINISVDNFAYIGQYKGKLGFNYNENEILNIDETAWFNSTTYRPVDSDTKFIGQFIIGNPNFVITTSGINRVETFDTAPYIENERTMLSVAAAGLALDAQVSYEEETRKVTVISGTDTAEMIIGDNVMLINGEEIEMDTAPVIRNSRTFLPIAYLGQALGADVQWVASSRTVILTKN